MDLNKFCENLIEENDNIFEETSGGTVDWDFDDVTILKSSGGKKGDPPPPPPDGEDPPPPPPPPSNEEDIDPPDPEDGEDGEPGESKETDTDEITIGKIVQDMKTGKYGRVTGIYGDKVEMEPVSDADLKSDGYKTFVKRNSIISNDDFNDAVNWGPGSEQYT